MDTFPGLPATYHAQQGYDHQQAAVYKENPWSTAAITERGHDQYRQNAKGDCQLKFVFDSQTA
jgi:hypothetical protein